MPFRANPRLLTQCCACQLFPLLTCFQSRYWDTLWLLTNAFHLLSLIPNIHTHLCLCAHPISLTQLNDYRLTAGWPALDKRKMLDFVCCIKMPSLTFTYDHTWEECDYQTLLRHLIALVERSDFPLGCTRFERFSLSYAQLDCFPFSSGVTTLLTIKPTTHFISAVVLQLNRY